jgi:hypothetical protein
MKFRVLFIAIALVAMTSFAFAQDASIQFNYYGPFEYTGNNPLTSGGDCFAGTPIPDNACDIMVYAGGTLAGSFAINGNMSYMGDGYFYGSYVNADPGQMWYCELTYGGCTYTSPTSGPHPTGPASVDLAQGDWSCLCEPPPPTCQWFEQMFGSICLTFTDGGEENGIDVCWCCPYGTEPDMLSGFGWIPGCNHAGVPWYDQCDDPTCMPYAGNVYFSAQSVETSEECVGATGHWTMKVWTDGEGCICLHWDHQLPVELTAAPVVQVGDRQLTLSFDVADELNVTHYDVMRDGAKVAQLEVADGSYTYVDNNLVNGRRYEYSIVAAGLEETIELEYNEASVWAATPSFKAAVVTEYALHQNYPNPFNPSTEIVYDVLDQTHVTLKVYNVMGQEVATLVNNDMSTGRYAVTFDASGLTSGLYFYTVTMGDFTATKKMLLVQ